jgi:hypothetical protein
MSAVYTLPESGDSVLSVDRSDGRNKVPLFIRILPLKHDLHHRDWIQRQNRSGAAKATRKDLAEENVLSQL